MSTIDYLKDARARGLSMVGNRLVLKPWTPPKRSTGVPGKTLESVAACAALDLTYWADHPQSSLVWAVDDQGRAHEVEVDRKTGVARHYCGKNKRFGPKGQLLDSQPCAEVGRRESWAKPETMTDMFAMLGSDTVPDPGPFPEPANPQRDYGEPLAEDLAASAVRGPLGHCMSGRHQTCTHSPGGQFHRKGMRLQDGTRYHCPCSCHRDGFTLPSYTAAERKMIKARNESKKAKRDAQMDDLILAEMAKARRAAPRAVASTNPLAIAMIVADPGLIATLHADYLIAALGHTEHDEQITAELNARGITTTEAS